MLELSCCARCLCQVRLAANGWLNDEAARRMQVHPPHRLAAWLQGTILPMHANSVDERVRAFLLGIYY